MVAFEIVVVVVCVVSAGIATAMFVRARSLYNQIGRLGGHWIDHSDEPDEDLVREDVEEMRRAISAAREHRGRAEGGRRG